MRYTQEKRLPRLPRNIMSLLADKIKEKRMEQSDEEIFKDWMIVSERSGKHLHGYPVGQILCRNQEEVEQAIKEKGIRDPVVTKYVDPTKIKFETAIDAHIGITEGWIAEGRFQGEDEMIYAQSMRHIIDEYRRRKSERRKGDDDPQAG